MMQRWCAAAVVSALLLLQSAALYAAPGALSQAQARHLLLRTGFASTQAEVDALVGRPAGAAVLSLLEAARQAETRHPAPAFVQQPPPPAYRLLTTVEQRQAQRREQLAQGLDMKRWWVREMLESRAPLRERMTLFWHNHFATSQQKVVRSQLMWRQHLLLRAHALGSFRTLLHAVAKDPAMLVYLDGVSNRRDAPNENFAREVMELFVLGESSQGNAYGEQDIREAARAFTGWSVDADTGQFRWRPFLHDAGVKTVLGHSARMDGDDVLDLLLRQDAAATFLVSKLWREFVSPDPQPAQVQRIARLFATSDYDIALALKELLLTDAFWAADNPGTLVKSPLELVVGTVRQLSVRYDDTTPLVVASALLGQNLLAPPNVKGWPGYTAWVDATSLLGRRRFAAALFQAAPAGEGGMARPMAGLQLDAPRWLSTLGALADTEPDEAQRQRIAESLLALPPTQEFRPGTVAVTYLRALMQDAAYQLK